MTTEPFAPSQPLTLGVEEELMILDATTLDQVGAVDTLLRATEGLALPGALKTELFASVVELATGICGDVGEVETSVRALRAAAAEAAAAHGLALAAAGTHPFARPEAQPIVQEQRYTAMVGFFGLAARRQGVQGLHVHVGMPSGEAAWSALEWLLPWLPVVLALSANSPWLGGERTGLASSRAPVLTELPRAGAPPAVASYDGFVAWVDRLADLGVLPDYTRVWWDVRPHPRLGTLEVRMPDQPTAARATVRFAALVQALAATALDAERAPFDRALYAQNRWTAARFGPEAQLIHPDATRVCPVPELWAELRETIRPAAERLGTAPLLDELDATTCEGALQLASDDPHAVTAELVARTLG